jgi:hypothetical protein
MFSFFFYKTLFNVFIILTLSVLSFTSNNVQYNSDLSCFDVGSLLHNQSNCDGSLCNFTEVIESTIDFTKNSEACYRFISPDPSIPPSIFRLSISSAYLVYPSTYYYVTGDTITDIKGFCGCPGGTSVSCSSCPVNFSNVGYTICSDGNHQNKDCILNHLPGAHGTFCIKRNILHSSDIHVYRLLNSPVVKASLATSFNGTVWFGDFSGFQNVIDETSKISVLLTSDSINPVLAPDFMLWHNDESVSSSAKMFLLPHDFVNEITECNPEKVGWFKGYQNPPVCSNFNDYINQFNITIKSCNKNQFIVTNTLLNSFNILNNLSHFERDKIEPEAITDSPIFVDYIKSNLTTDVSNGLTIWQNGVIVKFGFSPTNLPIPGPVMSNEDFIGFNIKTGAYTVLVNECHFYSETELETLDNGPIGLLLTTTCNLTNQYVSFFNKSTCDYTAFSSYHSCSGYIRVKEIYKFLHFPTHNVLSINSSSFAQTLNTSSHYDVESLPNLFMPIKSGSLNFKLTFTGLQVKFESSTVKPFIDSLKTEGPDLIIFAKSLTTSGRCYISSSDVFFVPQPVDLTGNILQYKFDTGSTNITGTINVSLICANSKVTKSVFIQNLENLEPNLSTNTTVPWGSVLSPFEFPSFSSLSIGQKISKVISYIVYGFLIALAAGVVILIISFIFPFLLKFLSIFRFKRPSLLIESKKKAPNTKSIDQISQNVLDQYTQ